MIAAYLAAAILGGALLVASLFSGQHQLHEFDHGAHNPADHGGAVAALVLSLRFWTYLCAFGGIAGLLLRKVAEVGEPTAMLLSLGAGIVSGVGAQLVIRRAGAGGGGVIASRELVFKVGTMLLPASPGVSSRVRLTINNQIVDLTATTEDSSLAARDEVVVLDIKDGVAIVTRNQPAGEKP